MSRACLGKCSAFVLIWHKKPVVVQYLAGQGPPSTHVAARELVGVLCADPPAATLPRTRPSWVTGEITITHVAKRIDVPQCAPVQGHHNVSMQFRPLLQELLALSLNVWAVVLLPELLQDRPLR